jgi:hypothetical protein
MCTYYKKNVLQLFLTPENQHMSAAISVNFIVYEISGAAIFLPFTSTHFIRLVVFWLGYAKVSSKRKKFNPFFT